MHQKAPNSQHYPAQNINSAVAEQPQSDSRATKNEGERAHFKSS